VDINFLRTVVTVAAFAMFIGILVWTCMPSRKARFDDAAQLPFQSE
jgi:cytochrome c oxidase cbb3-type subunit 4